MCKAATARVNPSHRNPARGVPVQEPPPRKTGLPFEQLCGKIEGQYLLNDTLQQPVEAGRKDMEVGVVIGLAAFGVMALIAVLVGIIAAVSTVSGIDTRDNEGD